MNSGNIDAGSYIVDITNNATSAVSFTSGSVIGKLRRAINTTGTYEFPVGTDTYENNFDIFI